MVRTNLTLTVIFALLVLANGCGDDVRLLNVQIYPAETILIRNGTVYVPLGGSVQYQIVGWYSDRKTQTIATTEGTWSSSNASIATVDNTGLVVSAGPQGLSTIAVSVKGHKATSVLDVCDPSIDSFCPPSP
jgi:hypothetical protein